MMEKEMDDYVKAIVIAFESVAKEIVKIEKAYPWIRVILRENEGKEEVVINITVSEEVIIQGLIIPRKYQCKHMSINLITNLLIVASFYNKNLYVCNICSDKWKQGLIKYGAELYDLEDVYINHRTWNPYKVVGVDKEEIKRLIQWYKDTNTTGMNEDKYFFQPIMKAMGNDVTEMLIYLNSMEIEDLKLISGVFELIYKKYITEFVYDELENLEKKLENI